jgi:hypothetical protein
VRSWPPPRCVRRPSWRPCESNSWGCTDVCDFTLLPEAMDFAAFARDCWFGPMDLGPFTLIDGDLALSGHAIGDAPEDLVDVVSSAAMERHKAINWLTSGGVYSETDTPT